MSMMSVLSKYMLARVMSMMFMYMTSKHIRQTLPVKDSDSKFYCRPAESPKKQTS